MTIIDFDTQINTVEEIKAGEAFKCNFRGYGGTDIGVNWRWMQENDVKPQLLVCFTDGETWDQWGDSDYCETLWVIHTNDRVKPPFGQTVYYG